MKINLIFFTILIALLSFQPGALQAQQQIAKTPVSFITKADAMSRNLITSLEFRLREIDEHDMDIPGAPDMALTHAWDSSTDSGYWLIHGIVEPEPWSSSDFIALPLKEGVEETHWIDYHARTVWYQFDKKNYVLVTYTWNRYPYGGIWFSETGKTKKFWNIILDRAPKFGDVVIVTIKLQRGRGLPESIENLITDGSKRYRLVI